MFTRHAACAVTLAVMTCAASAQMAVVSTSPSMNALNVPIASPISITFDRPVDTATFTANAFWAFGKNSGRVTGPITFSNGDQTVTLTPANSLFSGELVTVVLANSLKGADSVNLRAAGYSYQFTCAARSAPRIYRQVANMTARTAPPTNTRIYGAQLSDLNSDRFCDITLINEDSADIRVFLSRTLGDCTFFPFLQPVTQNQYEASPNEPSDFDRDGKVDVCTSNTGHNSVSIHLGNGDGTFRPRQVVPVGTQPHGIAVLDADGDGDMDIACANGGGNSLSLMLNNGSGVFGPSSSFEGGGNEEYGLTAADMNNDGIMDLVVGFHTSQTIAILRGNGNGTFTNISSRPAGGQAWKMRANDINGDGKMDAICANSTSNNVGILKGNGDGTLQAAVTVPSAAHVVAAEVGDLDGDGDLDLLTSSFSGGRFRIYTNNAAGAFTFDQEFVADSNSACAVIGDLDNDRDLDLVLLDEIADTVRIQESICRADWNRDGTVTPSDVAAYVNTWSLDLQMGTSASNFDANPAITPADVAAYVSAWFDGLVNGC